MYTYVVFCNFLQERGCEDIFKTAFERAHPGYKLDATLWEILCGDEFFIGRAFDWSATPEGRDFWLKLDKEWEKTCNNL